MLKLHSPVFGDAFDPNDNDLISAITRLNTTNNTDLFLILWSDNFCDGFIRATRVTAYLFRLSYIEHAYGKKIRHFVTAEVGEQEVINAFVAYRLELDKYKDEHAWTEMGRHDSKADRMQWEAMMSRFPTAISRIRPEIFSGAKAVAEEAIKMRAVIPPEGNYTFRVAKIEERKSPAGNPMLCWELQIVGGEYDGQKVFKKYLLRTADNLAHLIGDVVAIGYRLEELENRNKLAALITSIAMKKPLLVANVCKKDGFTDIHFNGSVEELNSALGPTKDRADVSFALMGLAEGVRVMTYGTAERLAASDLIGALSASELSELNRLSSQLAEISRRFETLSQRLVGSQKLVRLQTARYAQGAALVSPRRGAQKTENGRKKSKIRLRK